MQERILIIYECTLLHRIYRRRIRSALYERPRGHNSERIQIHATLGKMGSSRKCFSPNMQESTLCGDAVLKLACDPSVKLNRQEWDVSPTISWAEDNLNQLPFSPWCMHAHFVGESLPMLWKCEEASTEDASRPTARPTTEGTKPQVTLICLKAQSN